jgi:hypothetical protein
MTEVTKSIMFDLQINPAKHNQKQCDLIDAGLSHGASTTLYLIAFPANFLPFP